MDVSGNLFYLPEDIRQVPLPWHTRAPLGLRSGTSVHVALVESESAPGRTRDLTNGRLLYRPPDLLVSVLDPNAWDRTYRMVVSTDDGPGLLHNLLKNIQEANQGEKFINVELGESFTVPDRECVSGPMRHHRTTLYVTHQPFDQAKTILDKCAADSSSALLPLPPSAARLKLYLGETTVEEGLLNLDKDWRDEARKLFISSLVEDIRLDEFEAQKLAAMFDFDVAHALADLDARAIRLTFPLRGAKRLQTLHTDTPNTAIKVTELLDPDYSILGGILSKADASSASLYLVVEPMPGNRPLSEKHFAKLKQRGDFRKCSSSDPCGYLDVLHENIGINEVARLLGKELRSYGNTFDSFVQDFVLKKAAKPKGRPKTAPSLKIEVCTEMRFDHQMQAMQLMRQVSSLLQENPILLDELDDPMISLTDRMDRLLTADACVFVIWKTSWTFSTKPENHPLRNAILHSIFASSSSLILIEGQEDEIARQVFETRALFRDSSKIRVRSFEWTEEHVEAASKVNDEPKDERWSEILMRQNSLYVRFADWLYLILQ